jgi:nicotinate-nucleotide pyrophosphorylase (carboxylating)
MNHDQQVDQLISRALAEDIGDGDHSTCATIEPGVSGKAVLKIKEAGILAGMEIARRIFAFMQADMVFTPFKKDGDPMLPGERAFEVQARVPVILECERLVLNCMQRMSGIATLTRQYCDLLQGFKSRLLDTRKTTPNFRVLEKEAVRIGGGMNHRFGLYDMIMLKDNHIDYCGGIENAIIKACDYVQQFKPGLKIEVETRSVRDVERVMAVGRVDRIMLDNFTPAQVREALSVIGGKYETEASGGITLLNIREYAATGVDYISSGAIIHQARSLDLSLKAIVT